MPLINNQILTNRELQIVKLILQPLGNKAIAQKLAISVRTVETHRRNTLKKLNCKSALDLMRWAIKNGVELDNITLNQN